MPHPVPIIIGTTLAVIGSGYAFKKFIYDPHLAPLIDALITQHRENQRQRHGYEPIPIPVHPHPTQPHPHAYPHIQQVPIPPTSSGRSSAVDNGTHRVSRRRRPTEMYELDDARIMTDEKDKMPPTSRPRYSEGSRHPAPPTAPVPAANAPALHGPPPALHQFPTPQYPSYQPREMKRPMPHAAIPRAAQPPAMSQPIPQPLVVIHPTPRRVPPSPMLINMDAVTATQGSRDQDAEQTPRAPRAAAAISSSAAETVKEASVAQPQALPKAVSVTSTVPVIHHEQVVRPSPASVVNTASAISAPVSAAPFIPLPPSRQSSRSTITVDNRASHMASPATAPISLVASPAPSSVSNFSHLSQISRVSSTSSYHPESVSLSDDLEIISVSGTTTSYVDAETYTPRSQRSPVSPSTPLSRAMSPPVHIDSLALGGFAQPLSAENLSLASLTLLGAVPAVAAPIPLSAASVSSWGEDEHWRSDSEWDALSDAGAGATH